MDFNVQEINMSNKDWLRNVLTEGINTGPTHRFFVRARGMGNYSRTCQIKYEDCLIVPPDDSLLICIKLEPRSMDLTSLSQRKKALDSY